MSNVINGKVPDTGLLKGSVHAIIGRDGYSAYELALKHGFVGTEEEWLLSIRGADGTVEFDELTPAQKESLKGEAGVSGVYVGSGDMPAGYNVQIDPNGNSFSPNDVYHTGNKPTAADIGALSSKGYITDNTNVDNLADGVYEYNGWASGSIVCSAGVPFVKAFGTWIKKTPYDDKSTANRIDTVINNYTGDVYTMYGYNGTWRVNKANPTPADIGSVSGSYTGNGSAAARTVATGGIGKCCMVYGGTNEMAYVTPLGAFYSSDGIVLFTADVTFDGTLHISSDAIINTTGIAYNYQVL